MIEPRPPGPRRLACRGFALLVFLSPCLWFFVVGAGLGSDHLTWEEVGTAQVVASPDELRVFLQVDRIVLLPGVLVSAPRRSVGHRQVVVTLSAAGAVRRAEIRPDDGPSFSPNLGRIFVDGEDIFLLDHRRAVLRWTEDSFELLPPAEARDRFGADLLQEWPSDRNEVIDAVTASSGWSTLFVARGFASWDPKDGRVTWWGSPEFAWNGRTFCWELAKQGTTLSLVERGGGLVRLPLVTTIDPTRRPISLSDYDARRFPSGTSAGE